MTLPKECFQAPYFAGAKLDQPYVTVWLYTGLLLRNLNQGAMIGKYSNSYGFLKNEFLNSNPV